MRMKQKTSAYRGGKQKLWRRIVLAVILILIAGFAVLEGLVITGAKTELLAQPDVMVILGAQVKESGPSVLLRDRLNTALEYLEEHPELPVVVSGGQGDNEPESEADAMADYLVERGISEARIWREDASHNTSQNLQYTLELLEEKGYDTADIHLVVVSNGFHLTRVRLLAGRYGLEVSTLAAPSSHAFSRVRSYIREAPALVKSFLFD